MAGISVTWQTADFNAALDRLGERVVSAGGDADGETARLFNATASGLAPHRSGRLAGSFRVDGPRFDGLKWTAKVGPTVVYGRREAIGFHGPDSIGRRYHEAGHRFMTPAMAETVARFNDIVSRHVAEALR
jgi:hypothetical protein